MIRTRSENRERRRGRAALCALLLATSAFALLRPASTHAQETQLRGEVSESAILADQQHKTNQMTLAGQDSTTPTTQLQSPLTPDPTSPGATTGGTGTATTGSIFDLPPSGADAATGNPPRKSKRTTKRNLVDQDQAASDSTNQDKSKPKAGKTKAAAAKAVPADASTQADQQDTGNRRAVTIDSTDLQKLDTGAERTGAIETPRKTPEADPFAAVGIKLGSFTIRPTLEQGLTYSSNADSSAGGAPALLSETTLRLNATSDWRENSAVIDGYGTFRRSISGEETKTTQGRIDGTLNVDLDHEWRAIAKLGYEAAPESASSPDAIAGVTSQPLRQTIDGSLGIEKDIGKLRLALTGAVSHDAYADAQLSDGTTLSQKDRDSTLYTATLRTGYQVSPALTPFTELEAGRRAYDQRFDNSGFQYQRSSTRLGARAGIALDLGEKLSGEFSAGWLRERLDDDRLPTVGGPSINANLKWSPERGTNIGLTGTTTVESSTTAGQSGDILYSARLTGERQIRANLTGNATLGLDWRDYMGSSDHDMVLSAEAGLTWWVNRYLGLTTRARTEHQTSTIAGRAYVANSIFVGMKVQR